MSESKHCPLFRPDQHAHLPGSKVEKCVHSPENPVIPTKYRHSTRLQALRWENQGPWQSSGFQAKCPHDACQIHLRFVHAPPCAVWYQHPCVRSGQSGKVQSTPFQPVASRFQNTGLPCCDNSDKLAEPVLHGRNNDTSMNLYLYDMSMKYHSSDT